MIPMLLIVAIFALVLSGLNWLIFVGVTIAMDLPLLKDTAAVADRRSAASGVSETDRLLDATGSMARAFRTAGAAPTAAAMSILCLLVATLAAGVQQLA
jgi:hypothetical protein